MSGTYWVLITILGPILLGLGLLWVMTHNRQTPKEKQRTERATRERYEQSDREDKARDAKDG
jgi:hypothetical protein